LWAFFEAGWDARTRDVAAQVIEQGAKVDLRGLRPKEG
jgi:hypothetical protein